MSGRYEKTFFPNLSAIEQKRYLKLRNDNPDIKRFLPFKFMIETKSGRPTCACGTKLNWGGGSFRATCSKCQRREAAANGRASTAKEFKKSKKLKSALKTSLYTVTQKDVLEFKKAFKGIGVGTVFINSEKDILKRLTPNLLSKYINLPSRSILGRLKIATGRLPAEKYCDTCNSRLLADATGKYKMFCGKSCWRHTEQIKNKIKRTTLQRFGVEHVSHNEDWQNRRTKSFSKIDMKKRTKRSKATCMRKYGVDNPSKSSDIQQKIIKACYKSKSVTVDGKTFVVQGYEVYVVRRILRNLNIPASKLTTKTPGIAYTYRGTSHTYFADFYVASKSTLLEVKSSYTLAGSKEIFEKVKAKALEASKNYNLIVLLVSKSRKGEKTTCVKLAPSWIKMTYSEIKAKYGKAKLYR